MNQKRGLTAIGILIVFSMLVVGCASSSGGAGDVPETVVFGAPLPLTGELSTEGEKQQQGYELWKETVNNAGGISIGDQQVEIDIQYYDYQSDTSTALQLAERLITQDDVRLLFGPFGSGATKAVSAVTERYEVPMIAPSASSEEVYADGYQYLFGTFTPNSTLTNPLVEIAASQDPPVETLAILSRNDLFPLSIGEAASASAEEGGIEVVYFEEFEIGTSDYSGPLTAIGSREPDWIFATGYTEDLVPLTRQMKSLNVSAPLITMIAAPAYEEFTEGLGPDAENITSAAWWHNNVRYEGNDVFGTAANYTELFEEEYGTRPDYANASASVVGVVFQAAIESCACVDPVQVREELDELSITTFFGPIEFGETGQNTALDPPIFQIQGGQIVVLSPDDIATGELVYPFVPWNRR